MLLIPLWKYNRLTFAMAALGMIHSAWATQVGDRAQRLAKQMQTGEWV